MKKYLIYITVLASLSFTGCNKFLDIEPTDKIPAADLFKDPNGAKAYLATLYRDLPIEDYMYMPGTGNAGFNNPKGNIGVLWLANVSEEAVQSQWGECDPSYLIRGDYFNKGYVTLRNVNLFKSIIPTLDLKQDVKDVYKGEAAFITAYVYFYLVQKFGGVPLIKELQEYVVSDPAASDKLVVPRSTEKETWEYVLAQCDTAAKYLPEQAEGRRASKWTALALKSRTALIAGSVAKFGSLIQLSGEAVDLGLAGMKQSDANFFYIKCIEASEAIMSPESGHGLYKPNPADPAEAEKNYRNLFMNPDDNDGEAIFVKGILKEGEGFGSSLNFFTEPVQTKGIGRISPALELVDTYEDYTDAGNLRSDGRVRTRTNENFSTSGFDNGITDYIKVDKDRPYDLFNGTAYGDVKKAKDARLWASIILPGTQWKSVKIIMQGGLIKQDGSEIYRVATTATGKDGKNYFSLGGANANVSGFYPDGAHSMTGFLMKKMMSEDNEAQYDKSTLDYIVFRHAEVMLNYAEAVFESGQGDTQKAKDALNAVRKRAAHTNNIDLTRDNLRKERMVELAFENLRFWDLKRWRILHTTFSSYSHLVLAPMLDLRENNPSLIFIRKTTRGASLNGPTNYYMSQYYEHVPRNSVNQMIQNP